MTSKNDDVIKILSRDTPVLISNDLEDVDEHSYQHLNKKQKKQPFYGLMLTFQINPNIFSC